MAHFSNATLTVFIPQPNTPANENATRQLAQVLIPPNELFTNPQDLQDKVCKIALTKIQHGDLVLIHQYKSELSQLRDSRGRTLLMQATADWQQDTVKTLVQLQIGIHETDIEGNTTLHYAAASGALQLLNLLSGHLGLQATNQSNQTPLHSAILAGQAQIVEALLNKRANVRTPCFYQGVRFSALPLAIAQGDVDTVDTLIKSSRCNFSENTPGIGSLLHIAITFHQISLLKHLFTKYPAESKNLLETKDENNLTPFMLAARYGSVESLHLLKEQGANIEAQDDQGRRALHHAVLGGQLDTLPWLLYLGCKINKPDFSGQTPPALARFFATKRQDLSLAQSIANQLENYALQRGTIERPTWITTTYENLIFQGGGAKGVALLGGLKYLQEKDLLKGIHRVGGTSAGAITAVLVAVGYDVPHIEEILASTDMMSFLDHPMSAQRLKDATGSEYKAIQALKLAYNGIKGLMHPLQMVQDLWHSTGVCPGDTFLTWLEDKISKQTGIVNCTFKELREQVIQKNKGKHLHVFTVRVGEKKELVRFSSEDPACDDLIVSHAIRCSMSIPGVYVPHTLHYKDPNNGNVYPRPDQGSYVDGGILYNFPLDAFDEKAYQQMEFFSDQDKRGIKFNRHTLGFSLKVQADPNFQPQPVDTIGELLRSFKEIYDTGELILKRSNPNNVERTVELDIPHEIGTLSFGISPEQRSNLVQSAYEKTRAQLDDKLKPVDDSFFSHS
jgi:NTE family protein